MWRCPWCNGYRRRNWTRWHDETNCISHSTNTLGKGMNPTVLPPAMVKKLDGNYTRMLRAILNKSWRQHPTRYQLYHHLPPITKTIQVRRARHAGHSWRSRDELKSDEDLLEAMNHREKRWERVRDIRASGTTWGWWWWYVRIFFLVRVNLHARVLV